jgi:hypothetical protein
MAPVFHEAGEDGMMPPLEATEREARGGAAGIAV